MSKNIMKIIILFVLAFLLMINLSAQSRRDTTPGGRITGGSGQPSIPELALGATPLAGNISAGQENWYIVRTTREGLLVVETHGDDIDTYLELYDEEHSLIDEDDDSGEWYNARIETYVVGERTFNVKVRAYGNDAAGSYRISAHLNPIPQMRELSFNATIGRNLEIGGDHWYRLQTTHRSYILVETQGENVELKMTVYNDRFSPSITSNQYGHTMNAHIEFLVEPQQVYYFRVRPVTEYGQGNYRILATYFAIPSDERNDSRINATNIRLGSDPFSVFFTNENEGRWFRFEMPRGGANIETFTSGQIDTTLAIYNQNGEQLFFDDDSGEERNAFINERLDQGTYYIELRTYSGSIGRTTLSAELRR
ncbi:MAG: hypothetical protein FWG98_04860 [Candidatus Cloacimonetes bacterium]|nr:hypothetical protein [Candidatus Cloacimonadota bacterium]